MTTSQTSSLSKPTGSEKVPASTFVYMQTRLRRRIHSLILKEFAESGLSQADLARRLGKKPDVVSRWLAAPANLRLSTLSDLLFAIKGGEIVDEMHYPLELAARNSSVPEWLIADTTKIVPSTLPEELSLTGSSTAVRILEDA